MRKLAAALVALAGSMAVMVAGTARADTGTNSLDQIIKAGTIRIAVPQDFPPFGSVGTDMQPQGYDIDVARLLAKDLGVKLQLVPVTSANRIPYLQTHKVDLVISSLGVDTERAKAIAFSEPYAPYYSGVFGDPGVKVSGPADLAGKTVGVTRGTLEDQALTRLAPKSTEIKRFDDQAATTAALLSGQVKLIASGNVAIAAITKDHPDHPVATKFTIVNSPCHIGLRRGDYDLQQWVNVFIYHEKLTGALDTLSVKWFGSPLPAFPTL